LVFGLHTTYRILISRLINIKNNIESKEEIIIIGSTKNSVALSRYLFESQNKKTIFFVDDNQISPNSMINGTKVISLKKFLELKISKQTKIYISYNKETREFSKILNSLSFLSNQIMILKSESNFLDGDFKKLELKDFFQRKEVIAISQNISERISKSVIGITGAGGSIGSQLAKKVLASNPIKLILYDFNEYSLIKINEILKKIKSENSLVTEIEIVLVNLLNTHAINKSFVNNKIDIIYHCAAYKHVDMSEMKNNFNTFFENNYINTRRLILLSIKNKIKDFILVSTDKAVFPTNLMGQTKRLCEIYLLEISNLFKLKNYKIVRFGNVFRSSGSVIPIFEKQIREGGPITVTDKNVKRYFMSIKEAVLLILESTIFKNNNLLVLEMGNQIKILDIAKLLIHLNPDKNIKINFSGLKKGEKFEEELSYTELNKTAHLNIFSSDEKLNFDRLKKIRYLENNYKYLDETDKLEKIDDIVKY